jgi:hypothetical protein
MRTFGVEELTGDDFEPHYPEGFPPQEHHLLLGEITPEQSKKLDRLVERRAGETEIDDFLQENPALLAASLDWHSSGHHGAWVIPQHTLRPRIGNEKRGLIPDYIVEGRNSGGYLCRAIA